MIFPVGVLTHTQSNTFPSQFLMIENLQFGALLMFVGMGMVFIILALLWGVIAIFQWFDRRMIAGNDEEAGEETGGEPATAALSPDLMAAILVALDRYRRERRGEIGVTRRLPPKDIQRGQARWVAVGRSYQLRSHFVPRRREQR